jgi:hypothetical protein
MQAITASVQAASASAAIAGNGARREIRRLPATI